MWIISFAILFLIGGSNGFRSECLEKESKDCDAMVLKEPQTADEILERCSDLQMLLECVIPAREKCKEDESKTNVIKKIVSYAERTCDPDNEIFKVIKNNFECVMSAFMEDELCGLIYEKLLAENKTLNGCEWPSLEVACLALTVSVKCGEESRDAALDMLMNADFDLLFLCTEQEIQELPALIESFELLAKEVETVEDNLSRRN